MRPRVLFELSRHLAVLLEQGLEGERGARIPVFVCHPLDLLQDPDAYGTQTAAVLYPFSVVPEERWRPAGWAPQAPAGPGAAETASEPAEEALVFPPLWVRIRYLVLLMGGTIEEQLEALAATLRTLHENGTLTWEPASAGEELPRHLPLRLLGDVGAWRELGLPEHRLTVAFEVSAPIPSSRAEAVSRVVERNVELEEEIP